MRIGLRLPAGRGAGRMEENDLPTFGSADWGAWVRPCLTLEVER